MSNLTCYDFVREDFGSSFKFPNLEEELKDVSKTSNSKDYSVSCLTCREEHKKEDIKSIRSTLSAGVRRMGYDNLPSLLKNYEKYDKLAKEYRFSRVINPFAKGKTRTERFFFLPYIGAVSVGIGVDVILPMLGIKTGSEGTVVGSAVDAQNILFSESWRRSEKRKNEYKRNKALSMIKNPNAPFFSDFLEQIENIDVKFVDVKPAIDYLNHVRETSTIEYVPHINFNLVNEKITKMYESQASQPKT